MLCWASAVSCKINQKSKVWVWASRKLAQCPGDSTEIAKPNKKSRGCASAALAVLGFGVWARNPRRAAVNPTGSSFKSTKPKQFFGAPGWASEFYFLQMRFWFRLRENRRKLQEIVPALRSPSQISNDFSSRCWASAFQRLFTEA